GGLNRAFLGLSYRINKIFSIEVDGGYFFGKVENSLTKCISDNGECVAIERGSKHIVENKYSGFAFNAGLNFEQQINNKVSLYASATFSPEMKLKNDQTSTTSIVSYNSAGNLTEFNTRKVQANNDRMLLPMNYSIGAGV